MTAVDGVPEDAAGLVPGLVIGDTSLTSPDLTADMTEVQMSHLSAVSGSNVSIVLAALIGLCSLLGLPRRLRPVVALIGLAGFVVLARPEPSVIRAAVMGAVGLLGVSTSRRRSNRRSTVPRSCAVHDTTSSTSAREAILPSAARTISRSAPIAPAPEDFPNATAAGSATVALIG